MVASNERYSVWVTNFEAQKQEERFERVETAVNEVACILSVRKCMARFGWLTHKEVVRVRYVSTDPEELHQVVKLAMNITTYLTMPCN